MTGRTLAGAASGVVLLALMLLSGCAGAPPVADQRYLLPITGIPNAPSKSSTHRLSIAPVGLAPFLRSEGIVIQTSPVTIHQGHNHLWAGNLATQLRRALRRALARKLPRTRVFGDRAPTFLGKPLRRLIVEVTGFHGRYDGVAVVAGQWWLRDGAGRLLASRQFLVERPLQADGYQALVKSLAAAWQSVAAAIAPVVAASW